jgi:hypothetical protein
MSKAKLIRGVISDDQIMDCLIMFEDRKIDAARMFSALLYPKIQLTTLNALKFLFELQEELGLKTDEV